MEGASGTDPRVEALAAWDEPVTAVRFVDGRRADALGRLGVTTVGGLLHHFPHRHLDLSAAASLASVSAGSEATVVGRVHEIKVKRPRRGLTIVEVAIVDGTGVLVGVWFNQPYAADRFAEGERVAFAGKVALDYGLMQIRNPLVEKLGDDDETDVLGGLVPIHPTTDGLSVNWLRRLVIEALDEFGDVPDALPGELRHRHELLPLSSALRHRHFPESISQAESARRTLAYRELLVLQLALRRSRGTRGSSSGIAHTTGGRLPEAMRLALGFTLTADQESAVAEVFHDLASPGAMGRLLLGDVGTGKTAVAAMAMSAVVEGGRQVAMMAPTEVLARQYAESLGPALDEVGVAWTVLTGATSVGERRTIRASLSTGEASVVFGTHALFSADVEFERLGLVIIDEQHRFGVDQRRALRSKGSDADLLVMTATPIPRTLALTAYGDLDTSYLRERPSGRLPGEAVTTRVLRRDERHEAYDEIRGAAARGEQAYVVCPLVDESESADVTAAVKEADRLSRDVFPDLSIGCLTGRMDSEAKDRVMTQFRTGALDVLVSTTVIEVGVDVPNATLMVVEDAERFGLAQLHQLRGRVGRGQAVGSFLLFADPTTDEGVKRMAAIEAVSDGFELAEIDLRLRGEGEVLGLRQSGLPGFHSASLLTDEDLLVLARADAAEILEGGSGPASEAILAESAGLAGGGEAGWSPSE